MISVPTVNNGWVIQTENQETADLNSSIEQINLTGIHRTFHATGAGTHSSQEAHRTVSRIDNTTDHETKLNKFKKTEIPNSFSNHSGIKLK